MIFILTIVVISVLQTVISMYVTRKWSGESSMRGNAVPLVPLLSQAGQGKRGGTCQSKVLTLEVEEKHFNKLRFLQAQSAKTRKNGWFYLVFYFQNFRRASENYVRLAVQSQINSLFFGI